MKRQQGFTLIELVVVIIILGILAVTAAPKFINLQSDARASSLEGAKAAFQGANSLVYSKAIIAGKSAAEGQVVTIATGVTVTTDFGYLDAATDLTSLETNLEKALDMSFQGLADDTTVTAEDWGVRFISATTFRIVPKGKTAGTAAADACFFLYTAASSTAKPLYTLDATTTSGC
jgi:MSHA pilin protein MshA